MSLFTIGHSNRSIEDFLRLLTSHGVTHLFDVRKLPGSRAHPHFNAEALGETLATQGIGYTHLPGLGGLRKPAANSPNTGWKNKSFQAFADYMQTEEFERNLDVVLSAARQRNVAIMCAEAVPWQCHRSLIADAAVVRNMPVSNIMTPARADPHKLRSFARVEGTRITYPPEPDLFADA